MVSMKLPDGLRSRPLTPADAHATYELFAAAEKHDTGQVVVEPEDIEGGWARPSFDLEHESVGVFDRERLVAAGEVYKARRAEATVHPADRGRGIGTWLATWAQECSARRGGTVVGQTVPVGGDAEALFRRLGYRKGWQSWVLVVPEGARIEPQPLPRGYTLRDLRPGIDDEAAFRLVEDAFNEWPDRQASTFEDWAAGTIHRPGFEPWQLRLAVAPDGAAAAVAFTIMTDGCGYVDQLATRRDQRGKGLARALLVDAFARAREHGATRSELATDSRTGALPLYEHVGMQISQWYQHWMTDVPAR